MSAPLRKVIEVPLPDGEVVTIEVTMRSIEVIERVFNRGLDTVIAELSNATSIKRHLIGDVISQWIPLGSAKLSTFAIKESVMLAAPEKFTMYAGLVLSVASYALHYLGDDEFKKAVETIATQLGKGAASPAPKAPRRRSTKQPTKSS